LVFTDVSEQPISPILKGKVGLLKMALMVCPTYPNYKLMGNIPEEQNLIYIAAEA
jgi:hypothetical protein